MASKVRRMSAERTLPVSAFHFKEGEYPPNMWHETRLIEINTLLGTIRGEGLARNADIFIIVTNKRVKLGGK